MGRGRGRYDYPQEIKDAVFRFLEQGFTAKETFDRVYNMGYDPPSIKTILQWWHKEHPEEPRARRSMATYKKESLNYSFTATKRVANWLNQQTNRTAAINTIIEWYLRELQLDKRRERAKARREKKKGMVE